MSDLVAYAAFRHLYPPPPRPSQIVPQNMWEELGAARFRPVTSHREPYGIVHNGDLSKIDLRPRPQVSEYR